MKHLRPRHHHLVVTIVFTSVLLGLIALALGDSNSGIASVAVVVAALLAIVFHFLLPGSGFFSAVFANSIGIYACIYVFMISQNFDRVSVVSKEAGFILPFVGFLIGSIWRRREIAASVESDGENQRKDFWHSATWILLLTGIGAASFMVPIKELMPEEQDVALLVAMTLIGLTALVATRDIATFLLDTAILFQDFFGNVARLVKPAFAFFTCYSLSAIVFGCLYTILDRFSTVPNFSVNGQPKTISLAEGLYLSVATLSTVGYGDLNAVSPIARVIVTAEIFFGALLLLFGVQAILTSGRKKL